MVQYKLTYLTVRGIGEVARLIFNYAGVPFEDDRIGDVTVVHKYYDVLPQGQVPVLTVDGVHQIAQSCAINRFLARRFGLAGKDDIEQAQVDSYGDFVMELISSLRLYMIALAGRSQDDKEKLAAEARERIENKFEKYFNNIVEASGSGFLAKSGLTWVDFLVANFYETALNIGLKELSNVKHFKTIHDNVKALPQLKDYFAKREQTTF